MSNSGLFAPLRRRPFRRLALSYAVNELGDWMGVVALSVLVFDRTGSAYATAALFLGTGFLPAIAAPVVVARAELPPPRLALPVIYCLEAAAFAALAVLASHFSLAAVVAVATIDGALALAGRALTRAIAAAMLEQAGELRAGNAILNVAFTGGAAVGPAIAGLVVAGLDVQTALILDAVSFCAIALLLATAGPLPQATPDPGRAWQRVKAGLFYIRGQARLRRLLIAEGVALVFFAAVVPIEVIYAKQSLSTGDFGYGLLLASWGAGMVAGSAVFATLRRASLLVLLFLSTLAIGLGYLGMALAPSLAAACVAATFGGVGNGVQWITVVSAVQELTEAKMQARVMSVLESTGTATPGLGYLLGGAATAAFNPRLTFALAGAGVVAVAAVAAAILARGWPAGDGPPASNMRPGGADDDVMVQALPAFSSVPEVRPSSTTGGEK